MNEPTPLQPDDNEEHKRRLRSEFSTAVWPKIEREIVKPFAPTAFHAAWLGFCAGRNVRK